MAANCGTSDSRRNQRTSGCLRPMPEAVQGASNKMPSKAGASERGMPARVGKAVGAPRMESKPKMGKGQGYAEGGRVPGYDMDRLPAKKPRIRANSGLDTRREPDVSRTGRRLDSVVQRLYPTHPQRCDSCLPRALVRC